MGFKWKTCRSQQKVLLEGAAIVTWRNQYLINIKQLREAGSKIFCVYETCMDSNLTFCECWQDESDGVLGDVNVKRRLIIFHVGNISGFL
jgi:hypothetical protein